MVIESARVRATLLRSSLSVVQEDVEHVARTVFGMVGDESK